MRGVSRIVGLIIIYLPLSVKCQNVGRKEKAKHKDSSQDTVFEVGPLPDGFNDNPRGTKRIRVMFYNVENLFDNMDDPGKNDEEYLPGGIRNWSDYRYWNKQNAIARVIIALGGWEAPEIVGLCEVENRKVLVDLVTKTALKKVGYDIIHEESPDLRGVDVALLYRPEKFRPFRHQSIRLVFPFDTSAKTRDILLVSGKILNQDTIHIFINHWPSKFGGAKTTEPRRIFAAQKVRQVCDSLLKLNSQSKILIIGDLNDEHFEPSIREGLKAFPVKEAKGWQELYNLSSEVKGGTHKFREHWHLIDHMIVSYGLLQGNKGFSVTSQSMKIFDAPFLLVKDEINLGYKPNRTYEGMRYNGGFADHLPVYLDLILKQEP